MKRREFLQATGAGIVLLTTSTPALSNDNNNKSNKKIVWLMLRGALDSLHTVVPTFDPNLIEHRANLVNPIKDKLLPLEQGFALHPALSNMHNWYQQKQMFAVVAVASPYRERSHFSAQDLLESGLETIDHESGWLARAIKQKDANGLAIAHTVPLSLRGDQTNVSTWYPSYLPDAESDLYQRLMQLHEGDEKFVSSLEQGLALRNQTNDMQQDKKSKAKFIQLAKHCGELLVNTQADCAMLEMGGWDTHNNQVGRLDRQLKELDDGLAALKTALAAEWQNTVVIIATEFGRTVKVNGTNGTDHGTASALLVTGGAVNGGKVLGTWPGLAPENLYQNRDLAPTSDSRSWFAALLHQHWGLNAAQLKQVFPDVVPVSQRLV
ncbi:DUF1501 domain-containing protein [Catenovulum agarivorans]|uniref:DUF1501 domain-containing protein n=1 Tax=Catenovulum agarivorans TaxID=1172192 RepID=UPI0003810C18|nr:DUF1501 domain-containing protein [Catenovulum agarivorans]